MRVYKFYLVRTFKERTDLAIKFNFDLKYLYDESKDSCLILYAWTTDKDMKDEFKSLRSNQFVLSSSEIYDEEMFRKFSVEYKTERLDYYKLRTYNRKKEKFTENDVLMTANEHTTIVEYTFETFGSYMEHFCYMSYSLYKDKYIDALDLFLYTIFHDIYNAENESIEDMASYCYFKNETPSGRNISKIVESIDQIHLFSAIFSEFSSCIIIVECASARFL